MKLLQQKKEPCKHNNYVITDHLKDLSDNNDLNNQTLSDRAVRSKGKRTRVQRNNTNIKNQDNNIHKLQIYHYYQKKDRLNISMNVTAIEELW